MIALAFLLGGLALALGVALALVTRWGLSASNGAAKARENASQEHDRAEDYHHERDGFSELLAKERALTADLRIRVAELEAERNELARAVSAATVARVEAAPLAEGAAIVNDLFAAPLQDGGGKP